MFYYVGFFLAVGITGNLTLEQAQCLNQERRHEKRTKPGCALVIMGIIAITGLASPSLAEAPNNKPDAPAADNERSGFAS